MQDPDCALSQRRGSPVDRAAVCTEEDDGEYVHMIDAKLRRERKRFIRIADLNVTRVPRDAAHLLSVPAHTILGRGFD